MGHSPVQKGLDMTGTKKPLPKGKRVVKRTPAPKAATKTEILDAELARLARLDTESTRAADALKEQRAKVLSLLSGAGKSTHSAILPDGHKITTTVVQGDDVILDHEKLKKKVGAKMWEAITTRVLDKNKMDAHVKSGEISGTTLAECSEIRPRTPHIRTTVK